MGCCLSTNNEDDSTQQHLPAGSDVHNQSIKPHPPSMELESVKKVLSENPTPKPPPEPIKKPLSITNTDEHSDFIKIQKGLNVADKKSPANIVEISEVSETCSLSESISANTVTERRDDDGEVCQRINRSPVKSRQTYRSYSGDLETRREMMVGMSPNRRSDRSPGGRTGGRPIRPVQSRDPTTASRGLRSELPKREPNVAVSRRSMSPATRSYLGQSPGRKPSRSQGMVKPSSFEGNRGKSEHQNEGNKSQNESLENPLVSMECFIFL